MIEWQCSVCALQSYRLISLHPRNNSKISKNRSLRYLTCSLRKLPEPFYSMVWHTLNSHAKSCPSFAGTFPNVPGFPRMWQVAKLLHGSFPAPKQRYPSQRRWARLRSMSTSKMRLTNLTIKLFIVKGQRCVMAQIWLWWHSEMSGCNILFMGSRFISTVLHDRIRAKAKHKA